MTLRPKTIEIKPDFIGREHEQARLAQIDKEDESSIVVMYGRRRVGKTELLEQAFRERRILKFEGIEDEPESRQMSHMLWQLSQYADDPSLAKHTPAHWVEVLKKIADLTTQGTWTIYFEEVQWIANYEHKFIAELKYVWDNYFRYNNKLILILCGSSSSFIINNIVHSTALYNRSEHDFHLREFNPVFCQNFLPERSQREVMDAYLTVGGIPVYLKRLHQESSVLLSLCKNAFVNDSYFYNEHTKIFASSLANNKYYKKIIEFLSKKQFSTRKDILQHLKVSSGGKITEIFEDLEECGFIKKYAPFNLSDSSRTVRYCINDSYLRFYYKFIKPLKNRIREGEFDNNYTDAIQSETYYKWLGYAFERMCVRYSYVIARMLGFSAVQYSSGAYFSAGTDKSNPGFQIDLVFYRKDGVYTICEIRYTKSKVKRKVIDEFEKKLQLFPNSDKYTIQKVLISASGAEDSVINERYFDRIITLEDFFDKKIWNM